MVCIGRTRLMDRWKKKYGKRLDMPRFLAMGLKCHRFGKKSKNAIVFSSGSLGGTSIQLSRSSKVDSSQLGE